MQGQNARRDVSVHFVETNSSLVEVSVSWLRSGRRVCCINPLLLIFVGLLADPSLSCQFPF